MKNNTIINILHDTDNYKKEEYIDDSVNAIFHYINSTESSPLLDDLDRTFPEALHSYTNLAYEQIFQDLEKLISEINAEIYYKEMETAIEECKQAIKDLLLKTKYISKIEAVVELYNKENERRKEWDEFNELDDSNKNFIFIAKELDEHRHMKYRALQQKLNLSDEELLNSIELGERYLNFDWNRDNSINYISLNRRGKKYVDYRLEKVYNFSQADVDRIVEKNCKVVCESAKLASQKGIVAEIKIVDVSPRVGRHIKSMCSQYISEFADNYCRKDFVYNSEMIEERKDDTIYEISGYTKLIQTAKK